MEPIDPTWLRAGSRLPTSVFTRHGVKLLAREVTLTENMCRTLGQFGANELYGAESVGELRRAGVLRTGAGGVSLEGVLDVELGESVEGAALDAHDTGALMGLEAREAARLRSQRMKMADDVVADRAERWSRVETVMERGFGDEAPGADGERGGSWPDAPALRAWRGVRVAALKRLMVRVLTGVPTACSEFDALADELIELRKACPGRYVQVGLCAPERLEFLPDHAFTTSALCVAIASRLGWNESGVRLAALAGMLSDIGMGLIPTGVRGSTRSLDEIDSNRVRRHPTYSVMLLDCVEGLPDAVSLAAYQHHERTDGSGYPQGLKGKQVCDLAKVVAVADAFAASMGPRPYKPAKRPYDALEEVITMGSEKLLDRVVVRALVESTGLFPVGSFVRLSTGDLAEVVGTHAGMIDRPVVTVLRREGRTLRAAQTIDLAAHQPWDLHVILPADPPTDAVTR